MDASCSAEIIPVENVRDKPAATPTSIRKVSELAWRIPGAVKLMPGAV